MLKSFNDGFKHSWAMVGLRGGCHLHSLPCLPCSHNDDQGLIESFFGEDGKKSLKLEQFAKFLRDLHNEIVLLEFAHYAGGVKVGATPNPVGFHHGHLLECSFRMTRLQRCQVCCHLLQRWPWPCTLAMPILYHRSQPQPVPTDSITCMTSFWCCMCWHTFIWHCLAFLASRLSTHACADFARLWVREG